MAAEKRPSSLYFDLISLRERFNEVDRDGKGYIDYEGLQVMIANMETFDSGMARELMDSLDRDKDGKVTLEDFQTLYTVERDVIKEKESTDSSFSPNKPPTRKNTSLNNSSKKFTTPSPVNPHMFRNVPDSPDLASHARSLRGTVYEPPSPSHVYYKSSELGGRGRGSGEDVVLEDTGGVRTSYHDERSPLTSPKPHSFYGDIKRELKDICPSGVVQREHIMKLSGTLGLDTIDQQELIGTWEEYEGEITVDNLCYLLQEKEKIALIGAQPGGAIESTQEGWQQYSSLGSPLILKDPPKSSTPYKKQQPREEEEEEEGVTTPAEDIDSDDDDDDDNWMSGANFNFIYSHQRRPSSAKEGLRLSRGYNETGSLRQTVMMQSEYRTLQEKLIQVTSENDSLKANFARIEEEKKNLIVEGEESIQQLQRIKKEEINAVKDFYNAKVKEMEKSFATEQQLIQERADNEITVLKEQLLKIKNDNKTLQEDYEYYQNDNQKLIEELHKLRLEIKEKDNRIARLHETFGLQMESPSDTDLERQATRIQDLEKDLNDYAQHSDDLRSQNRELQDKVDELNEECETLKMKLIEEKRKRQRQRTSVASLPSARTSSSHISHKHHKRVLPLPVKFGTNNLNNEETDSGDVIEITNNDDLIVASHYDSSDEGSENFEAISSASLLEEIKNEENKQFYIKRIFDLEKDINLLEENCKSLKEENETLFQSNEHLNQEYNLIKTTSRVQLHQIQQEKEEIEKELSEIKATNQEMSTALKQENLELQTNLLLAQRNTYLLEDKCEELETHRRSLEHELKMKSNEVGLAIHDLTKKEEDCNMLQEQIQTLEIQLEQLNSHKDKHLSQINQLKIQLDIANRDKSDLKDEMERQNELILSPPPQLLSPIKRERSKPGEDSFFIPTSPLPFSPNRSFASNSTSGRSEIVSQMKTQLEDLQRVLIQKGGQDITDEDMTVIQELLDMNTTLEENMAEQRKWYEDEISDRDKIIENYRMNFRQFKSHLTQSFSKLASGFNQKIQKMSEILQKLYEKLTKVSIIVQNEKDRARESAMKINFESLKTLQDSLEMTEHDLEESEKKRTKLQEIITRQKNELELVNHYLGKAKSLELQYDREKEESEKRLREKENDLHTKRIEILELKEKVKSFHEKGIASMPDLHVSIQREEEEEEVDGIAQSVEDLAEEDIDLLRSGLQQQVSVSLLQEVRGEIERMEKDRKTHRRSTETAEDLISMMRNELTRLYQDIVNATATNTLPDYITMIGRIRETVNNLKIELSNERQLLADTKTNLTLKTQEYEQLYTEHKEEMYEKMEYLQETNTKLKDQLHHSLTKTTSLEKQKNILIETIQQLTHQTLTTLIQ